jgi:phosphoribosyl-AMP cyclohydrolase / phosphoribosyl-ATP pyrophosphohydrolase
MPSSSSDTTTPNLDRPDGFTFDRDGLVAVVVQDRVTGEVRMVAHANLEAIEATLASGRATFWSRSRRELWEKGKTSGNSIAVSRVLVDCDADCLLYMAEPLGPSCHTGAVSCFFRGIDVSVPVPVSVSVSGAASAPTRAGEAPLSSSVEMTSQTLLARLEAELEVRKSSTGKASYTKSLYEGGTPAIGAKIEEEARELARALAHEDESRVVSEAADVLYHVMVGLRFRGIAVRDVLAKLDARAGTSGHAEKASRVV